MKSKVGNDQEMAQSERNSHRPSHEKTNNMGFQPGRTQTEMYNHRRWLEAGNFGFRKYRKCTIRVAKTKALISFAVNAKLIWAFDFAYADCCFSHEAAHILSYNLVVTLEKCLFVLWYNVMINNISVMLGQCH